MTAIAVLTLLPEHGNGDVRLLPFSELADAVFGPDLHLLLETVANVFLFLPFGAALRLHGIAIGRTALFGFCVSACIELAQFLFISGRTVSFDDVLLNTLGALVGNGVLAASKLDRRRSAA